MASKAKNIVVLCFASLVLTGVIVQTLYHPIPSFESDTLKTKSFKINSDKAHDHSQPTSESRTIKSVKSGAWSDLSIWDSKKVPSFGDNVVISSGTVVTYDVHSTNPIGNLKIDGKLVFSRNKSTNLDVGNIEVSTNGVLEIGSKDNQIPSKYSATIRFVMGVSGQNGLIIKGQAEIHGAPIKHTFTKLASDVTKGDQKSKHSTLFVVDDVHGWSPGSKIVITTTGRHSCTELKTVQIASGRTITLAEPLKCYHSGKEPARAEVALLTRNVVITSKNPNLRAHTMFMDDAKGSISYAEFVNLGPQNQLGKYPIHFHKMGDSSKGMYVQGASIWNSTNRWITIHSSNGVTLRDNVAYNSVGHGYFLEAGDEMLNVIDHNIGVLTNRGTLITSDVVPSVFWLENPRNKLLNNIAVQGQYFGYKYDVPNRVQDLKSVGKVNLRGLPILQFDNNEAHNNGAYGLWTSAGAQHDPTDQTMPISSIKNFLSWRNGSWGVYLEGRGTNITASTIFGNKINLGFGNDNNVVYRTHIMGEVDKESRSSMAGILFDKGVNNIVKDSVIEGHIPKDNRTPADIKIGAMHDNEIIGKIVNTKLLSPRTIIFGYPQNSMTHLIVQGYSAPNDNHSSIPSNFTLWRIDNQMSDAKADIYFVALVQRN